MKNKGITLYSTSVPIILTAFMSWFTTYVQSPTTVDMNQLKKISEDLKELVDSPQDKPATNDPAGPDNVVDTEKVVMGWLYPGEPSCDAIDDAKKYSFGVLKPEYFSIREGGVLELMTEDAYGCNGYSSENVAEIRKLSKKQFVTVSSSYGVDMDSFLKKDMASGENTKKLVDFVVKNQMTGIELDFEDYGGWSKETTNRYMGFVKRLGTALHAQNKQLMVDLPPVRNEAEENWYHFRLSEFNNLPVDYILIMTYDYQFDYGAGQPVAPAKWIKEVVAFTKDKVADDDKIVIGLPSYGYQSGLDTKVNIVTLEQAIKNPLFSTLRRDLESNELIAKVGSRVLVSQDSHSLSQKIEIVKEMGINKVSIWHIGGGNPLPKD